MSYNSAPVQILINCVSRSTGPFDYGRIIGVSDGTSMWTAADVAFQTELGISAFFVVVGSFSVQVIAKQSSDGSLYLSTSPDGFLPNNLEFLSTC